MTNMINNTLSSAMSSIRRLGKTLREDFRRFDADEKGEKDVVNQILFVSVAVMVMLGFTKVLLPEMWDSVTEKIRILLGGCLGGC